MAHTKEKELEVIKQYRNGRTLEEIARDNNVSKWYINRIRKKYNEQNRYNNHSELLKHFDAKTIIKGSKTIYYVDCSDCLNSVCVTIERLSKAKERNKKQYTCSKCSMKENVVSEKMCKCEKKLNNTTGFIGVSVFSSKGEVSGYRAVLQHHKQVLLRNSYKDKQLHSKTLIQAAVDRDLFIIERSLPHTRNFSDTELLGKMEYLAHSQLLDFKDRVSSGKVVLNG